MTAAVLATPIFGETPPEPPITAQDSVYEPVCAPLSVTVYFGSESAEITSIARAAIEATIDDISDCAVTDIQTTTVSSDAASSDNMLYLSEARSDNVLESIAAAGIWAPNVQADIVLVRDTNRPDTAIEPMARRVEVKFTTAPAIIS